MVNNINSINKRNKRTSDGFNEIRGIKELKDKFGTKGSNPRGNQEREILTREEFDKFKEFVNASDKDKAREARSKMLRIDE